jgi:FAD synthetase
MTCYDLRMKVLVFGTFDYLHPGHLFVLKEASKRGELWAVVARDRNVEKLKGRLALQTEDERKKAVGEAIPAIHAVLGDATDFLAPVREIKPDLILLGYDQALPPGVKESDLPCEVERLPAFEPDKYKSSLRR